MSRISELMDVDTCFFLRLRVCRLYVGAVDSRIVYIEQPLFSMLCHGERWAEKRYVLLSLSLIYSRIILIYLYCMRVSCMPAPDWTKQAYRTALTIL